MASFWHLYLPPRGAIISQDEIDIYTAHLSVPMGKDMSYLTAQEVVNLVAGADIKIDEVIVTSRFMPTLRLAEKYGNGRNIFLVGDAAHQVIPTGGYGMNTGVGDAVDIGWKLAAVLNGWGGSELLKSYEEERWHQGTRVVDRSGRHFGVHKAIRNIIEQSETESENFFNEERSLELRKEIHDFIQTNGGENTDYGIEMGSRYNSGVIFSGVRRHS